MVGEYEWKTEDGDTLKHVFLENGIVEWHRNGTINAETKWSIANGEIHIDYGSTIWVSRINTDKSITWIANIDEGGKRTDYPKEDQFTYKRIK